MGTEKDINEIVLEYKNTLMLHDVWKNPVVQCLYKALNLLPSPADVLVEGSIEFMLTHFQNAKEEELLDRIFSDNYITMEDLQDVQFILDFAKILAAVRRLSSNKKVVYMANLFKYYHHGQQKSTDEFEEYLRRIEELSNRELEILAFLYHCEFRVPRIQPTNEIDQKAVYNLFEKEAPSEFNLSLDDILSILVGVTRSGFCSYWGVNYPGRIKNIYYITEYFRRFYEKIRVEE